MAKLNGNQDATAGAPLGNEGRACAYSKFSQINKILFALTDVAFLAAGHCWMAHGNVFSGNIFKFVAWASFILAIAVTSMNTPMRSNPLNRAWRPWAACFGVAKVLMTAGFGQFTLAAVMAADSLLLWRRVREWDRQATGENA